MSRTFSGKRAYANRRDGFALGNLSAAEGGPIYPLATTNGGKTWRTAGPEVNPPVAQGGSAVAQAGVVNAHTWYMCCGGNAVVDVTPDAGRHWWQAFLPGTVLAVYAGQFMCGRLIALVQPFTKRKRPPLWAYTSMRGRSWTYAANQLAPLNC